MEEGSLTPTETVSFDLAPRLGEIARMVEIVEAFGETHRIPPATLHQVTLVLDELITNIVSYGIAPGEGRPITVALTRRRDALTIALSDPGRPFDPRSVEPPDTAASLEERKVGGLGVHFARTMMDSFDWRYHDGRNHVTLTKRIDEAAA
jgi:serine/threonine-protein kinase RsbW